MKLTIKSVVIEEKTIDIEFPYYYKFHQITDDHCTEWRGKIEENAHISIKISRGESFTNYEMEVERGLAASSLGCYMCEEHASSEGDFLEAKRQLLIAVQGI